MEGWSWTSLDYEEFLDFEQLDAVVTEASREAAAPGLGFSVHDSDSVYLVGADAAGVRFRVVVNAEAFEDELPEQDLEAAAAWAREHASLQPTAEEIEDVLARQFVFAEEGLDLLLARIGLLPPGAGEGAQELNLAGGGTAGTGRRFDWTQQHRIAAPERLPLPGPRWWASITAAGDPGYLLAAEQDVRLMMFAAMDPAMVDEAIKTMAVPEFVGVSSFAFRSAKDIAILGHMPSLADWRASLTEQGMEMEEWREVPDDVPRDLASTAAWITSRGTSDG